METKKNIFGDRNYEVDRLLMLLSMNLEVVFNAINGSGAISLGTLRSVKKCVDKLELMLKKEENEFVSNVIKVYKKYGMLLFEESILSYVCVFYIFEYLSNVYSDFNEKLEDFTEKHVKDESQLMQLEELIEGIPKLGEEIQNPYVQVVTSSRRLRTCVVDDKGGLYELGKVDFIVSPENILPIKIGDNVKFIEVEGPHLCGIDLDGRLWSSDTDRINLVKIYKNVDNERFVKSAVFRKKYLLALAESGSVFIFEIAKVLEFKDKLKGDFLDISSCEDYAMVVNKKGTVSFMGEPTTIGIINHLSSSAGTKPIIYDSLLNAIKCFAFTHAAYIIDAHGRVFGKYPFNDEFKRIMIPGRVVNISFGQGHVVFLTENGECYGCGDNTKKELGTIEETTSEPIKFSEDKALILIAGRFCTFIVTEHYEVIGLGYNDDGRMGLDNIKSKMKFNRLKLNWLDMLYKI